MSEHGPSAAERTAADVVLDALYDSGHLSHAETVERIRKYLAAERWRVVQTETLPAGLIPVDGRDDVVEITQEWTS